MKMKKTIFICCILSLVFTSVQAQSFMDKMKSEKSQSTQKTTNTPVIRTQQNNYQKMPLAKKANTEVNLMLAYPDAVDMYFRYTDQVQGGRALSLAVGDRIKVLPGQTISDSFLNRKLDTYNGKIYYGKTGISFDPKNPKICGKIFTVASTNPIKFQEKFPENMRNGFNSSFSFKVIKL